MSLVPKCQIIYKGDVLAGAFYLLVGTVLLIFAIVLDYINLSLGYHYLSIGFFIFFLYCIGKGLLMIFINYKRYKFYKSLTFFTSIMKSDEIEYTEYRIQKKQTNRRRYTWTLVLGCLFAFLGIFSSEKGLIMGTAIPIALIAGIEFGVGLLTEFRLREFLRILKKNTD